MHLQRLLALAACTLAACALLPTLTAFNAPSIPQTTLAICRAQPIVHFDDIESDSYLAAIQAEIATLTGAQPDITIPQLMDELSSTHQVVTKGQEQIEYFFYTDADGVEHRICRLSSVITVVDPAQIVPVHVRVDVTVDV